MVNLSDDSADKQTTGINYRLWALLFASLFVSRIRWVLFLCFLVAASRQRPLFHLVFDQWANNMTGLMATADNGNSYLETLMSANLMLYLRVDHPKLDLIIIFLNLWLDICLTLNLRNSCIFVCMEWTCLGFSITGTGCIISARGHSKMLALSTQLNGLRTEHSVMSKKTWMQIAVSYYGAIMALAIEKLIKWFRLDCRWIDCIVDAGKWEWWDAMGWGTVVMTQSFALLSLAYLYLAWAGHFLCSPLLWREPSSRQSTVC